MNSPQTTDLYYPATAMAILVATASRGFARLVRTKRDALRERRRQRRAMEQLRGISDRTLRDIGISRSEIASTVLHGRRGR